MLDAVKDELERQDEGHINSIQALMLFYIGGQVLSANELKKRGYPDDIVIGTLAGVVGG